jgi:uncharacterized membrane protein YjgN (DUF898 family)
MEANTDAEPIPGAVPSPAAPGRDMPLEFRGTGGEYFRIWIVNLLLTIVTLGIYSAWAKVRRMRYFYGSTLLDGTSFEYHGQAKAILKGRLIALGAYLVLVIGGQISPIISLVLAIPIMLAVPWIIVRARLFQMRMTSWRGLRFNFHGNYQGALAAYIGWMLLAFVTIGILWPLALWKQVKFLIANTAYGKQRFGFTATSGRFYRFCVVTLLISLGLMVLVGIAFGIVAAINGGATSALASAQNPADAFRNFLSSGFIVVLCAYVAAITFVTAYYKASMLNASFNDVEVGPHRLYSRLDVMPLAWILLTNLLGMILTLGLFYPWAKVRSVRYQLTNMGIVANGDLNQFSAASSSSTDAVGEEIGEFFDIDFGF